MKNGTRYRIQPCVEPDSLHSREFLKTQIADALQRLSGESRWLRFAAPVSRLSEQQLDALTSLDGWDRMAWCASIVEDGREGGVGLARYVRLEAGGDVAEFALTILDDYQGQGVGYQLLRRLAASAAANGIRTLRAHVLRGNRRMLALARRCGARTRSADAAFIVVEIPLDRCHS